MYHTIDGLPLWAERHGAGPATLLLHGFSGSGADWAGQVGALVAAGRTAITVDLLGHGRSAAPAAPARYTMDRCVADLLALMDAIAPPAPTPPAGAPSGAQPSPSPAHGAGQTWAQPGEAVSSAGGPGAAAGYRLSAIGYRLPFDVVGYSLGGRVALSLAVAAPHRVRRLVLESASPGLADPAERAARVAADTALAQRIERAGIAAFVDEWERLPLFASQAQLPPAILARQRAQRLSQRPHGLANSLIGIGTGRQPSLWAALPALTVPALIITGAHDEKFGRTGDQMAALLPHARRATIAGAGHNTHLERPEAFNELIVKWVQG